MSVALWHFQYEITALAIREIQEQFEMQDNKNKQSKKTQFPVWNLDECKLILRQCFDCILFLFAVDCFYTPAFSSCVSWS